MRIKPSIMFGLGIGLIALYACSSSQRKIAAIDAAPKEQQKIAQFEQGLREFETYKAERAEKIEKSELHSPKLLSHGHPTDYVVIFIHGLFESPYYNESIVKNLYKRGITVVMPTLPGHWAAPAQLMDQTTSESINQEIERVFAISSKLGTNVIFAGFSLGGMLSVRGALAHPEKVKGLLLWAPALGLTKFASSSVDFSRLMRFSFPKITGNDFIRRAENGIDVPYISSNAGVFVNDTINSLFRDFAPPLKVPVLVRDPNWTDRHIKTYQKIQVPTFVVYSQRDELISYKELNKFYSSLSGEKERIVYVNKHHNGIARSESDQRGFSNPNIFNEDSDEMLASMNKFLDKYFPMSDQAKLEAEKKILNN